MKECESALTEDYRQVKRFGNSYRAIVALLLLLLIGCGSGGSGSEDTPTMAPAGSVTVVRILPLGDSITAANFNYRFALDGRLRTAGFAFDFVGSENIEPRDPPGDWDRDHEGHRGFTTAQLNAALQGFLQNYTADWVLLHIGTNDMIRIVALNDGSVTQSLGELEQIVQKLRAHNPNIRIFLAQILPFNDPNLADVTQVNGSVMAWNQGLVDLANRLSTATAPIVVVDMNTGFPLTQLEDGVHPTEAGAAEMADRWARALLQI